MNCTKCGAPLNGNDQFCRNCGAPIMNAQTNQGGYGQPQNNVVGQRNNMTYGVYNQMPQKSNISKYIIIALAVIIVILIGVLVFFLVNNKDDSSNTNSTSDTNADVVQTSNTSSYKVNLGNFIFSVPDDLTYEKVDDALYVGDVNGTWAAQFSIMEGSYTQLNKNKAQMPTLAQQSGFTATAGVEQTLSGVNFVITEIGLSGNSYLVAYAEANSMNIFEIQIMNLDNDFDYDVLEKYIAPIVASATYSDVATNIEFNSNINTSQFASLAK